MSGLLDSSLAEVLVDSAAGSGSTFTRAPVSALGSGLLDVAGVGVAGRRLCAELPPEPLATGSSDLPKRNGAMYFFHVAYIWLSYI